MRRAITQCRNALSVVIRQGQVGMPEHVENRVNLGPLCDCLSASLTFVKSQ